MTSTKAGPQQLGRLNLGDTWNSVWVAGHGDPPLLPAFLPRQVLCSDAVYNDTLPHGCDGDHKISWVTN
jgi:hypothetical protein